VTFLPHQTASVDIPAVVRNKARVAGADDWLAGLPELVDELAGEWSFTPGASFADSTEAYVIAVTLADGTPAVLKLLVPRDGDAARREITVLHLAGGEGCARLLRADETRGAMLLERLGRSLFELRRPVDERHEILCTVAARLWRPATGAGLPTGAEKGQWLAAQIIRQWHAFDRPCAERTIEHALDCAERRIFAHDDERAVLVHGDVHQWNTLRAGEGWKLVDPDGLLADAEYDLGIIMREDPEELLVGDPGARARRLAALTGRDVSAIWEWGVVERVSTGLLCIEVDLQPWGDLMLRAADRIAAEYPAG